MNNEFYMNYVEGQDTPMVKYNNKDMAEKEACNEYEYWPWFEFEGDLAGFAYAYTYHAVTLTDANFGSRLCFRDATLARYVRETSEDIYNDYLLNKD